MTTSLFFLMWGLATALALPLLLPFHVRGIEGMPAFMAANALAVLSLLAYASAEMIPPAAYVMVSNAAWACSAALVYIGVRQFFGMHPHILRTTLLCSLCTFGFALLLYRSDSLVWRMVLYSVYTCVLMAATGAVIFRQRRRIKTKGVVLYLLLAFFGVVALHALRGYVYGAGVETPVSLLQPSAWSLFFIVCGSVTVPGLFLALLFMIQTSQAEKMQAALTFDSLTQAYSRRSIMDELEHELLRCERTGGKLAVLVLDIDHFKSINDRYGHAGGDTALRHFARVVQNAVRSSDRFGRLGGEEFVLLMYDCDPASALVQAQRVCDALRDMPLYLQGLEVQLTTSGGLASYQPGDSADVILARADVALYRAKEQGRDRVEMAWSGRGVVKTSGGLPAAANALEAETAGTTA
ncbi:GGDEF domain-containing protein [Achromobacter animicus]|uniref:GGDEF domain-containing protein n=1 Tax=Achromobacter animicus TaxID=1389935 RepID=UPI0028B1E54D|nr:GGDEF domain-containing protein [Achromobacter animicus]